VDGSHSLNTTKNGWYNADDGKVHYTVALTSDGVNDDVSLTDSITGTALILDKDSLSDGGAGGTFTVSEDGKSFTYVPKDGKMTHNQSISITYTASVDTANLTGRNRERNRKRCNGYL